jgi:NADH-quinone oxidoreductase subunit M
MSSFVMTSEEWFPSLPFLIGWLVSASCRRRVDLRPWIRVIGVGASILSLGLAWDPALPSLSENGGQVARLLTIAYALISVVGFAAVPHRVISRSDFATVFFASAACMVLFRVANPILFVLFLLMVTISVTRLVLEERACLMFDSLNSERITTYIVYRILAWIALIGFIASFGFDWLAFPSIDRPFDAEVRWLPSSCLVISMLAFLGLFPFHSWLPLFLGAPRLNIFIPLLTMTIGVTFFLRLFLPLYPRLTHSVSLTLTINCAIGLIYVALLLFGEHRLKRIGGYVVMSHLGFMVLAGTSAVGSSGLIPVELDTLNLLFASGGLVLVLSCLSSRFGLSGVTSASGLASTYPELGLCFLVCALSLVGFPGTIGFISEELLFQGAFAHQVQLVPVIVIALALNGYSCFRLFARSFFGSPSYPNAVALPLVGRERVCILIITGFILINGFVPDLVMKFAVR